MPKYLQYGDASYIDRMNENFEYNTEIKQTLDGEFTQQKNVVLMQELDTQAVAYQNYVSSYLELEEKQHDSQMTAAKGGGDTVAAADRLNEIMAREMDALMEGTMTFIILVSLLAIIIGIILP